MVRTRVGYAGGKKAAPTYRSIGDHSETVQIDFAPEAIGYTDLLETFWKGHDPTWPAGSRQYMSAVFYHDAGQKKLAEESLRRQQGRTAGAIHTRILPMDGFTRAEAYHQKHALRGEPDLLREYTAIYPDRRQWEDSTAVARVNGFLGGFGDAPDLQSVAGQLGLSDAGLALLERIVSIRSGA